MLYAIAAGLSHCFFFLNQDIRKFTATFSVSTKCVSAVRIKQMKYLHQNKGIINVNEQL
ncbi:hypothetical protein T08_13614 [Trichinella sp. T8]|nr:hypothetical protein T08_13614 [Trichinella sp. T8]